MHPRTKRRVAAAFGWAVCAAVSTTSCLATIPGDSLDDYQPYRLRSGATATMASRVTTNRRIQTTLADVESETEMADARGRHHVEPMERNIFVHESSSPPVPIPSPPPSVSTGTSGGTPMPNVLEPTMAPLPTTDPIEVSPTADPIANETMTPSINRDFTLAPTIVVVGNETEGPTVIELNETEVPTVGEQGNETDAPTTVSNETLFPTVDSNETLAPSSINGTMGPLSLLEEFLTLSLTDDGSLTTPGTPQFEALTTLETTNPDLTPGDQVINVEILQRYVLNTLFFSTNGANWIANEQWTSETHPCGDGTAAPWFGVECNAERSLVQFLSLPSNDVAGTLPSEIRGLIGLQSLNIFENQLSGTIPNDIGSLTMLTVLEAGSNFFDSTIPASIGDLTSLDILNLYSNFLTGGIPATIGNLQALRSFSVDTNFLSGSLPQELFTLSSIGRSIAPLNEKHTFLGIVSHWFFSVLYLRLVTLDLDNNQLSGTLPTEIGLLTSAASLSFSTNLLEGVVPSELGDLQSLVSFAANVNFLSGALPDVFEDLVMLRSFEFALNFLTGQLPPSLLNLEMLEVLDLSGNQLSGLLSEDIGGMMSLRELRMDRNLFSGQLPMNLTQLENLEVISMSQNFLTGIPVELSALPVLRELQVSANFLTQLPEELVNDFPSLGT